MGGQIISIEIFDRPRHNCHRKRRYTTEHEARKAARRMEDKIGEAFTWYACHEYCGGYHVGRKMQRRDP